MYVCKNAQHIEMRNKKGEKLKNESILKLYRNSFSKHFVYPV